MFRHSLNLEDFENLENLVFLALKILFLVGFCNLEPLCFAALAPRQASWVVPYLDGVAATRKSVWKALDAQIARAQSKRRFFFSALRAQRRPCARHAAHTPTLALEYSTNKAQCSQQIPALCSPRIPFARSKRKSCEMTS